MCLIKLNNLQIVIFGEEFIKLYNVYLGNYIKNIITDADINYYLLKISNTEIISYSREFTTGFRFLSLWDIINEKCLKIIIVPEKHVVNIIIKLSKIQFITGDKELSIKIWNLDKGLCIITIKNIHKKCQFSIQII